jgi:Zn-finger nucleic acid-binding protein
MTNCKNCGAALPPDSLICSYCKTRHDADLHGIHRYTTTAPETERICPRCQTPMKTIDLKIEGKFLIERCDTCLGMFFDPGELEALLDKSVTNVYYVDRQRLEDLKKARRHSEFPLGYIKCPVCRKFMNRLNFGSLSGVIVDKCRDHGIWLDGGELRHLMEWTKAGGQIHHQKRTIEKEKIEIQQEKEKLRLQNLGMNAPEGIGASQWGSQGDNDYSLLGGSRGMSYSGEPDLLNLLGKFVRKLLR